MSMPPTYAIGDVHGRPDLLQTVIAFCEEDAARRGGTPPIILLGDIVDRGRDAKGCLEIVGRVLADHRASIFLRGNHDDWFLENDGRQLRTCLMTAEGNSRLPLRPRHRRRQRFLLSRNLGYLNLMRPSSFMVD